MICLKCSEPLEPQIVPQYHYKQCGLDNVYFIHTVRKYESKCGEKYFEFPQLDIVYLAIAYCLLKKKALLNPKEFRFLRKWVGLTAEKLIGLLGVGSRVTVSNWERGTKPITSAIDHSMRMVIAGLKDKDIRQRMELEIAFEEWLNSIRPNARQERIKIDSDMIQEFQSQPVAAVSA